MPRPLVLAVLALVLAALIPLAVAAETPPPSRIGTLPLAPTADATVTATGEAVTAAPANPLTVYAVQLQGQIDGANSLESYTAKLERIRQSILAAGVPADHVTPATYSIAPAGASSAVSFNSLIRYEVGAGAVSVAAAKAAFAAGATMVYSNMPTSGIGTREPEGPALDAAIATATAMARRFAERAVAPQAVGDVRATTLSVTGEPANAPLTWRVQLTLTFAVR